MGPENKMNFSFNFKLSNVSSPAASEVKFNEDEYKDLREFVYHLCGIYLSDNNKKLVENRLSKRLSILQLENFRQYVDYLKDTMSNGEEIRALLNAVTVGETNFFRDKYQLEAFQTVVFPELLEAKSAASSKEIRILSVGCSTGEEPFTLAMLIKDLFAEQMQEFSLEIIGTDISNDALVNAQRACFPEHSFYNVDEQYVQTYFSKAGNVFYLNDDIGKMVKFKNVNLADSDAMKSLGMFDIIFCRNVLIYFDKNSKIKSIQTIFDMLNPDGYCFIGQSESLHGISRAFKLMHFIKAIGYRKSS